MAISFYIPDYSTNTHSVTLSRNPVFGSNVFKDRFNQMTEETGDGGQVCVDSGPLVIRGILLIKGLSSTEAANFETWISTYAIYGKNIFSILPPANFDAGAGKGTEITGCYYTGKASTEGLLTIVPPGYYDLTFAYRKV